MFAQQFAVAGKIAIWTKTHRQVMIISETRNTSIETTVCNAQHSHPNFLSLQPLGFVYRLLIPFLFRSFTVLATKPDSRSISLHSHLGQDSVLADLLTRATPERLPLTSHSQTFLYKRPILSANARDIQSRVESWKSHVNNHWVKIKWQGHGAVCSAWLTGRINEIQLAGKACLKRDEVCLRAA